MQDPIEVILTVAFVLSKPFPYIVKKTPPIKAAFVFNDVTTKGVEILI